MGYKERMDKLRNLIDLNSPIVFSGSWDKLTREGWRFAVNLNPFLLGDSNERTIRDLVQVHGVSNVAFGQSFHEETMRPRPEPSWFGVYVRDVDIQADQFAELLQDDQAIARWIS